LADGEKNAIKEDRVNKTTPNLKIFFLPYMSPKRPKGKIKAALASINDVGIHPSITKFSENSFPIDGSETFNAAPINGIRKAPITTTTRTKKELFLSIIMAIVSHYLNKFKKFTRITVKLII
jgi:hypothetical protein